MQREWKNFSLKKAVDVNEAWRQQYVEAPGWGGLSAKTVPAPGPMSAFDRFLQQQQQRFARSSTLKDDSDRSVAAWLKTRTIKLQVKRDCLRDTIWRWRLIKSYVLQSDFITNYIPLGMSSSGAKDGKTLVKRYKGAPPPIPPAIPPPFRDEVTAFNDLAKYKQDLAEHLASEWVKADPKIIHRTPMEELELVQRRAQRGEYGRLADCSVLPTASLETKDDVRPHLQQMVFSLDRHSHLSEGQREDLDGEEKRQRMQRYGERIRDGLVFSYAPFYKHPVHQIFSDDLAAVRASNAMSAVSPPRVSRSQTTAQGTVIAAFPDTGSPTKFELHGTALCPKFTDASSPTPCPTIDFSHMKLDNVFEILKVHPRKPFDITHSSLPAPRPGSSASKKRPGTASSCCAPRLSAAASSNEPSASPVPAEPRAVSERSIIGMLATFQRHRRAADAMNREGERLLRQIDSLQRDARDLEQGGDAEATELRALAESFAMHQDVLGESSAALGELSKIIEKRDLEFAVKLREKVQETIEKVTQLIERRTVPLEEMNKLIVRLEETGEVKRRQLFDLREQLEECAVELKVPSQQKELLQANTEAAEKERLTLEIEILKGGIEIQNAAIRQQEEQGEKLLDEAHQLEMEAQELEGGSEMATEIRAIIGGMPQMPGAAVAIKELEQNAEEFKQEEQESGKQLRQRALKIRNEASRYLAKRNELRLEKQDMDLQLAEKWGELEKYHRRGAQKHEARPLPNRLVAAGGNRGQSAMRRVAALRQGAASTSATPYAGSALSRLHKKVLEAKSPVSKWSQRPQQTLSPEQPAHSEKGGRVIPVDDDIPRISLKERRAMHHRLYGEYMTGPIHALTCQHLKLDNNRFMRAPDDAAKPVEETDPSEFTFLFIICKRRFADLSAITTVDLSFNRLETFPPELTCLRGLQNLFLQANRIAAWDPIFLLFRLPVKHIVEPHERLTALSIDAQRERPPKQHGRRGVPLNFDASTMCTFRCRLVRIALHENPIAQYGNHASYKQNLFLLFPFLHEVDLVHILPAERRDMFSDTQNAQLEEVLTKFMAKSGAIRDDSADGPFLEMVAQPVKKKPKFTIFSAQ